MISLIPTTGDLLIRAPVTPVGDRLQRTDIVCLISSSSDPPAIRYCFHETFQRQRPGKSWEKTNSFRWDPGEALTHQVRLAVLNELSLALWEITVDIEPQPEKEISG